MEPVVRLHNLNAESKHGMSKRPQKRRRNRRLLFGKRKFYYMKSGHPSPEPFLGWQDTEAFLGFDETDINLARSRLNLNAYENNDFVTGVSFVHSIGSDLRQNHCMVVRPVFKRRVRILAVYDGVASCLIAMKRLRIDVDMYFSSENLDAALKVQEARFPGQLIALGSVEKLSDELLHSLGPIHLLTGGPPCQDLSMLNAKRREFSTPDSTAFHIMRFRDIRNVLQKSMHRSNEPFFWFLETSAHMSRQCRRRVSNELGSDGHVICASSFSSVFRKRLYFGNIPQLEQLAGAMKGKFSGKSLQSVLGPNRIAKIQYAHCLTTNISLQCQPVIHKNEAVNLSINEQKKLNGLPESFTDVQSISVQQRRGLIGRGWHIDVICAILEPLKDFFVTS